MTRARRAARRAPADPPQRARRPGAGERCEMCAEPIADEHEHVVDLARRSAACAPAGRATCCSPTDGAAAGATGRCPTATAPFADCTLPAGTTLQIPVGAGVLLPQLGAGPDGRVLPGPGRGHRVRAAARRLGPVVGRQPAAGDARARRRGAAGARRAATAGSSCYLVPIDACYELVGQLRTLWRASTAARRRTRRSTPFFDAGRRSAAESPR